ncbi:hypothetical protein GCM10023198_57520 [Promicromonospora umidemergens]|uniref:Uncharacterized protein n=1 Tax=Promicromonospora umidemergens TaxID=629679 RepID=A0ABP8YCC9_9MICO
MGDRAALTAIYTRFTAADGTDVGHIMATVIGENAFLVELEHFLRRRTCGREAGCPAVRRAAVTRDRPTGSGGGAPTCGSARVGDARLHGHLGDVHYFVLGSSQAMQTAWVEDMLSSIPPLAFSSADGSRDDSRTSTSRTGIPGRPPSATSSPPLP